MACYHPLRALWYGEYTDSGKKKYKIVSKNTPISNKAFVDPLEVEEIPCNKCIGCRLEYSRRWAVRCMLEAKQYEHNQFITLTYNEDNITWKTGANRETGEIEPVTTLVPEDLTKFMKDLRRYYKYHYNREGIRFYACGEYGARTYRAHYHIIAFNLPIEDKEKFFINKSGEQIYISDSIEKIWGKGQVTIGDVTWNSAAYVARYVMKKIKGKDSDRMYKLMGIVPEFVRMSRKPGIAWQYYDENKDKIYECDEIIFTNKDGKGEKIKPCKYYDRLYDLENPEFMQALKQKRKLEAEYSMALQLGKTSLSKKEYLEMKELKKQKQIEKLKRSLA